MKHQKCRVALYSPGMVGLGHIRRNASIAMTLSRSALQPVILMIAEARQAGALPMPEGVDCVTLPALRKEADGCCKPRYLDVSNEELITLRSNVISRVIKAFEPDMLIVDHLPLGAERHAPRSRDRAGRSGAGRRRRVAGPVTRRCCARSSSCARSTGTRQVRRFPQSACGR